MVEIVAGLSLKNLKPRVWDSDSPYYLPRLGAVMVSYADFAKMPSYRQKAMENGLHEALGVPIELSIFLDNGAFNFALSGNDISKKRYEEFVAAAKPDWYAIPQDYIPTPRMTDAQQLECLRRTMEMNLAYSHDGYVPIVHISRHLEEYLRQIESTDKLSHKPVIGLGGIVPNLLRAPKAMSYDDVLDKVKQARESLSSHSIHLFGVGGTATMHLAALLRMNSADSSGWRNRAARGIIQVVGCGDRVIADLGNWRGRKMSDEERAQLSECQCPSCLTFGIRGLEEKGIEGFSKRAAHNLWTLHEEVKMIEKHISGGTYASWYPKHLNNSTYRPLIDKVMKLMAASQSKDSTIKVDPVISTESGPS